MKVTYIEALMPSTKTIKGKNFLRVCTYKNIVDVYTDLSNESKFIMIKTTNGKHIILRKDDIVMIEECEVDDNKND